MGDLIEWLIGTDFVQLLINAVLWIYGWFRDLIWAFIAPFFAALGTVVSNIGDWFGFALGRLQTLEEYLGFANAWVPLDVFFQLCAAYSIFWLALIVYKIVKSWIPTLAGS